MLSSRNLIVMVLALLVLAVILGAPRLAPLFAPPDFTATPQSAQRIAYLSPANGPADIHLRDTGTFEIRSLTEDADVGAFDVSADGMYIYFAAANPQGGSDLWILEIDSGEGSLLFDCGPTSCDSPAVSPDGGFLAFEQRSAANEQQSSVWLLDLASEDSQALSSAGNSSYGPQWSPSGELSYYDQADSAYVVYDPQSGESRRHSNRSGAGVSWAADGHSFAAAEQRAVTTDIERLPSGEASFQTPEPGSTDHVEVLVSQLFSYRSTGREILIDIGNELQEDTGPAYSPDGTWLAFTRKYLDAERWTPGRQLWLLDLESGELSMLSEQPNHRVAGLSWSRDGQLLAYIRSNQITFGEPPELWIIDIESGSSQLLAVDAFAVLWVP